MALGQSGVNPSAERRPTISSLTPPQISSVFSNSGPVPVKISVFLPFCGAKRFQLRLAFDCVFRRRSHMGRIKLCRSHVLLQAQPEVGYGRGCPRVDGP